MDLNMIGAIPLEINAEYIKPDVRIRCNQEGFLR